MQKYVTPHPGRHQPKEPDDYTVIKDTPINKLRVRASLVKDHYYIRIERFIPEINWRAHEYYLTEEEYLKFLTALAKIYPEKQA